KDIISSREDGFGFLLKKGREEKKLSSSEVAKELHLDDKFIQALECEDYTQLPAPAFLCGYIRNYAKLVNLQPEALIADYKKGFGNEVLEPELKVSKQKKISDSSIQSTLFVLLFKFLLLAALVFASWHLWTYVSENYINRPLATENNSDLMVNKPVMEILTSADDDQQTLVLPVIETSPSEQLTKPVETSVQVPEESVGIENIPVSVNEVTDEPESSAVDETEQLPAQTILVDEAAEVKAESVAAVEESVLNETIAPASDNTLILEFAESSWIEIKDANNKTLASGSKKPGVVLTLTGQRPYDITIGNAQKVKISIDGKLFDHSAFINANSIARFTLP
ncbi:MAG: helix-turn-helix domain-containing protein, partial [Thiotrichaceae bacterium]|nr:helix-turn-helix domain-containing protein [Thiotrichaceae bacterium]